MKYLLGIDFGGGSTKATLIDTNGNIAASHMGAMSESTLRNYIEQLISIE